MDQDEYVKKAKAQLDVWNAEVKKMQAEMKKLEADGEAKLREELDKFTAMRSEAMSKLDALGKANAAAWKDMQAGFESAWKSLEKSVNEAQKHYKS